MSLFSWLAPFKAWRNKSSGERVTERGFVPSGAAGEGSKAKILLSGFVGDKGNHESSRLAGLLGKMIGVDVYRHKKIFKRPENIEDPVAQLMAVADEGRDWLKEEHADLLVWGEVDGPENRLMLHLLPAPGMHASGEAADASSIGETLDMPIDLGPEMEPVIMAALIATFGPTFKGGRQALGESLGGYLTPLTPLVTSLPLGLSPAQAVSILNTIGNAFVAHFHLGGGGAQLGIAALAYQEAEKRVSKEAQPLVWTSIQNNLASVLRAQGQFNKDPKFLRQAAVTYSTIAATLSQSAHRHDWGTAHVHLGRTLYILAGMEGKPEYLKKAVGVYEQALATCDKNAAPEHWADITNQYGVVLLALGEELEGNAPLEKAVNEFRAAMMVHSQENAPLLWAQTANNLGAACFALAKRNFENSLLREASDCFQGATEIYRQQGVPKQAKVIEKNLQRVQRLLTTRGG